MGKKNRKISTASEAELVDKIDGKTAIGAIIDIPLEQFNEYVKELPTMTEVYGLCNMLSFEYRRVATVKDVTLQAYTEATDEQRVVDLRNSYNSLMFILQRIEDKVCTMNKEKARRSIYKDRPDS